MSTLACQELAIVAISLADIVMMIISPQNDCYVIVFEEKIIIEKTSGQPVKSGLLPLELDN
jgi:hypothetical protein